MMPATSGKFCAVLRRNQMRQPRGSLGTQSNVSFSSPIHPNKEYVSPEASFCQWPVYASQRNHLMLV